MLSELWSKWRGKWWFWIFILVFLSFSVLISILNGNKVLSEFTDFIVFYLTGSKFGLGEPLYGKLNERFEFLLYPPFSAFLFYFSTFLSAVDAATLFSLFNILLYVLIVYQLIQLLDLFNYTYKEIKIPLLLAIVFSLRYYFANFNLLQINEVTLVLILGGVIAFKKGNPVTCSILFSIAACIKIIPAVFLIWLFFRVPRIKIILASILTALILFAIPFPFRGFEQSINDLRDFYIQILHPYLVSPEVYNQYYNQSLPAAIGRLLMPSNNESTFTYNVLNLPYHQVARIVSVANVVLALSFLAALFYRVRKKISFGLEEIALVFLFSHLYSSLTWKNHLVSMIVVFVPLFMIPFRSQTKMMKAVLLFLYTLLVILSLNISFLIPDEVRFLIGGFSLYTLMMMILYVAFVVRSFRYH